MQTQYGNLSVIKSQRLCTLSGTISFNFYIMYLQLRAHNNSLNELRTWLMDNRWDRCMLSSEKRKHQQPLFASSLSPRLLKKLLIILFVFFVFQKIMILGDFNADGRYLSKKKKEMIRICSAHYHWLIEDDVDTTSSNLNDHTYDRWDASQSVFLSCLIVSKDYDASSADRIVVYGQTMLNAVVPGSAKSFNFQREFKLTDEEVRSSLPWTVSCVFKKRASET